LHLAYSQAHYLESWGDARAFDGTVSLVQPLIAPLYGGKTVLELLGAFTQQQPVRSDYDLVRQTWRARNLWPDFEKGWRQALHDGLIANTALPEKTVKIKTEAIHRLQQPPSTLTAGEALEVNLRPDSNIWDGRFANNGWLQECPRSVNKLTWDNAVLISPPLAQQYGLATGDVVDLTFQNRALRAPVWIMPGQAQDAVTLHLGYGRTRVGRVGANVGFNANALRSANAFWFGSGLRLAKNCSAALCWLRPRPTRNLHSPDRQVYRAGTLATYLAKPDFIKQTVESPKNEENPVLHR